MDHSRVFRLYRLYPTYRTCFKVFQPLILLRIDTCFKVLINQRPSRGDTFPCLWARQHHNRECQRTGTPPMHCTETEPRRHFTHAFVHVNTNRECQRTGTQPMHCTVRPHFTWSSSCLCSVPRHHSPFLLPPVYVVWSNCSRTYTWKTTQTIDGTIQIVKNVLALQHN